MSVMASVKTSGRQGPAAGGHAGGGSSPAGRSIIVARGRSVLMTPDAPAAALLVEEGVFALEALLPEDRKRVIDFELKGDVVQSRSLVGFPAVRLRAIEAGRLVRTPLADWVAPQQPAELQAWAERHAARSYLLAVILGLGEVDARLASLLMCISLRLRKIDPSGGLDLKIPRDDIASHILVNPDTLSRSYSRLRKLDAIARLQRHRLVLRSWSKLSALTPLAPIIESVLG